MSKYQYSARSGQQSHVYSDRWDFPRHQCIYHEDWRLVATDLADDFHSNHDGWEAQWPVNIRIYKDDECVWSGDVDLEIEPNFYVI